ncbi:MAG: chloride channel protein [Taibaiella sp.]|nr:chloride channel protein [Taibaiella sp.]
MKIHHSSDTIPVSPELGKGIPDLPEERTDGVNKRVIYLSLQAIFNAIIIGVVARLLVSIIDLVTNISFYHRFSFASATPAGNSLGWVVIFVPVIGALIVGVMARFGSPAIRGHGIPEAMEQVLLNESKIKPIITFLKPISAAISIGTGGPFGAEGPIIATGGAFGSFTGQIMRVTANERKIMLAAGACAGMAAIFGSPLAAVLLAIELLLFEFSPRSIIPVALACTTGAAVHYALFGTAPVFAMPQIPAPTSIAIVTYVLLGVVIGVGAALVSKSVYLVEDLFEKLPIHWMWWPAIGAVAVGIAGYYAPSTLGVGYENIHNLLMGTLPVHIFFTLCFVKFLSWAISLGSGTSGGTMAPLLTIGGALGGLLGMATLYLFPGCQINLMTCALIGMAAMFAGASRALLTSIIFALETTMQPHGLLPLLGACTASYFVSFFLMKGSIMTEKIERRGIYAPTSYQPDVLDKVQVKHVFKKDPTLLEKHNTIKESREWIKAMAKEEGQTTAFVVTGEDYKLWGILNRADIFSKDHQDSLPLADITTLTNVYIYPDNKLSMAIDIMDKYHTDVLPVVDAEKNVLGILTHKEIFAVYHTRRNEDEIYTRSISLTKQGIRILIKGKQLLNKD